MFKQINVFLTFLCHVCGGNYWNVWYDVVCDYVCAKQCNKALTPDFYTIFCDAGYLRLKILIKLLFVIKR